MNKRDVRTKEDIELYYKKCRKIRLKNITPLSLEEIIKVMIAPHKDAETVYSRGGAHCNGYRYRSLEDIIKVCKFYFRDATVKDVYNTILKCESKLKSPYVYRFRWCPDIKRDNFAGASAYVSTNNRIGRTYKTFAGQGFTNCNVKYIDFKE